MDSRSFQKTRPRRAARTAVVNSDCCDAVAISCEAIVTTRLAL